MTAIVYLTFNCKNLENEAVMVVVCYVANILLQRKILISFLLTYHHLGCRIHSSLATALVYRCETPSIPKKESVETPAKADTVRRRQRHRVSLLQGLCLCRFLFNCPRKKTSLYERLAGTGKREKENKCLL